MSDGSTGLLDRPQPQLLGERYRIERVLGRGGMGVVYRARDLLQEQFGGAPTYIALKTLREEFALYPDAAALLYSEFALTNRLRHEHIVRPYSFEIDPSTQRAFLVLELLSGNTLEQICHDQPRGLSWHHLREIALPLLTAVQHAHANGVLHGDLKPSNVMLDRGGLRLFDFGLGESQEQPGLPTLQRSRFAAWTPRYAAPELLEGAPLSPATDLYALCCLLYQLSRGQLPYRKLTARQAKTMGLHLDAPCTLPRNVWKVLSQGLCLDEQQRCTLAELTWVMQQAPARSRWPHSAWRRA